MIIAVKKESAIDVILKRDPLNWVWKVRVKKCLRLIMWDFVVDYFTNMTFNLILIKYVYNISINVEIRSQSFVDKKK